MPRGAGERRGRRDASGEHASRPGREEQRAPGLVRPRRARRGYEIRALAGRNPNLRVHAAYSRPGPQDRPGTHYDSAGRVDGALLERLVGDLDAHFMLCGPTAFMAQVQTDLEERGVCPERIHTETFGPKG
jgi:ferredoxin-NADP reductase